MKPLALANKNWALLLKTYLLTIVMLSSSAYAFTDLEGKQNTINDHIGKDKWTVVKIWASECHICRIHMPDVVKFDGKLKNARILGVTIDGQAGIGDAKDFIDEFGVKFPTVVTNPVEMNIWMEQSIEESFVGTPTFIIFDPDGKLVAAQPGMVPVASIEKFITKNSKTAKETKAEDSKAKS